MQVTNKRAMAAGLKFRPIGDTANDMIAELESYGEPKWGPGGFSLETEAALLAKWHAT